MTPISTILSDALREVLYQPPGSDPVVHRFVAKVDELQEQNLGIAFARYCLTSIMAFPLPLRGSVVLSLLDTALPSESVVKLVRPCLDDQLWRPAMQIMQKLGVDRDDWFQSMDSVPDELQDRFLRERERRIKLFELGGGS